MSDEPKEVAKKMKKDPIWLYADVWLNVFEWLAPRQLGLRVALVGDRFYGLVDGHFRSRKWTFGHLEIRQKIGKKRNNGMEIVKSVNTVWKWQPMPIPRENIPLPAKAVGFKYIEISYIDRNAMAFLHRIRRLFCTCAINLHIASFANKSERVLAFILGNIWPLIKGNIRGMELSFRQLKLFRRFSPSILGDCPSLTLISSSSGDFPKFPADDTANASDGQALAKWLFTPRGDGMPKVLKFQLCSSQLKTLKREFINASSRLNFIIVIHDFSFVVPFELINELTGERLTLKRSDGDYPEDANDYPDDDVDDDVSDDMDYDSDDTDNDSFDDIGNWLGDWLLVRGPITRDEKQWTKWEEEAIAWKFDEQWNRIDIWVDESTFDDGLLNSADPGSASLSSESG